MPKKSQNKLEVKEKDILVFNDEDGKIFLKKVEQLVGVHC